MFTEHPAEHYDFFVDGNQGMKDGMLMIPGAEMQGSFWTSRMSCGVCHDDIASRSCWDSYPRSRRPRSLSLIWKSEWIGRFRASRGVEIYNTRGLQR